MDAAALSTALKPYPLLSSPHPKDLLRPTSNTSPLSLLPPFPHLSSSCTTSTASTASTTKPHSHHHPTRSALRVPSPTRPRTRTFLDHPPRVHRSAAIGYASALLDVARCEDALLAAERDACRLARGLRTLLAVPGLGEAARGEVVRCVAERGGFYRHLVALVRMLVRKGKVNLVGEVMEEFGRICNELRGTREVAAPTPAPAEKMEEETVLMLAM